MPRNLTLQFAAGTPPLRIYNEARKWFTFMACTLPAVLMVINAPFGRFTANSKSSFLMVDGIKSWIVMELVSPAGFIYTFLNSPLSALAPPLPSIFDRQSILAICFLIHYANRAVISPLRTPSRSKSHIIVPIAAVIFNSVNGTLMGSYLSSPFTRMFLPTLSSTRFWGGLVLWVFGFIGNVVHDEILLEIRRKAKAKGKNKESDGEHYAIPEGLLYSYISYPNYFCEWLEWLGFAIAAAPTPFAVPSGPIASHLAALADPHTYISFFNQPASMFAPSLSPPWIFLISEVTLMLPRAYRGHQWYHNKFKGSYPKKRKAVIPFLL